MRLAAIITLIAVAAAVTAAEPGFNVLAFSKTAGFRHGSIAKGHEMLKTLGAANGFTVESTEDAAVMTDAGLKKFSVVVFLSTTGDILDADQQAAFERFIKAGHGYVGIHSATDTEYDWPWYTKLVGAQFKGHPGQQKATLNVLDRKHPSTAHLGDTWVREDEWYNFKAFNPEVKVLIEIDEKSYQGGEMGEHHPMAWYHEYEGGRAWYTELGHTDSSYDEPDYQKHVLGGIRWAAKVAEVSKTAPAKK